LRLPEDLATPGGDELTVLDGTDTALPQPGHLIALPAAESGTFNVLPHWQRTLIGIKQTQENKNYGIEREKSF
jgi:hypothetical protein